MQVVYIFTRKETRTRDAAALLTYTLPGGISMADRLLGTDPETLQYAAVCLLRRTVPSFDTGRIRVVIVPVSAGKFEAIETAIRG